MRDYPIFWGLIRVSLGEPIPKMVANLNNIGLKVNQRTVLVNAHFATIEEKLGIKIEEYR